MNHGDAGPGGAWPVVVRIPLEPVEAAVEADALDAAAQTMSLGVRGPLFGVVAQAAGDGRRWRVIASVTRGCPQQARDSLNSLLWFRAKDHAQDRAERRELLAAVARLETERVDDLTVAGVRYRIVRAEEYAGLDAHGGIELPRPTDPEPVVPDWDNGTTGLDLDEDLIVDPDAPVTPAQAAERLALRTLAYAGARFPEPVLAASLRALDTHPDVLLLPAAFAVVQRTERTWSPGSCLHATAHGARTTLDFTLNWWEPRKRGLIPFTAAHETTARTLTAEGTDPAHGELAELAAAADRLRAERLNQIDLHDTTFRIGRIRRLLRWGPDGPEGPRPCDLNEHEPSQIRPNLDEDGNIHFEDGTIQYADEAQS
jgi:hypothetical protein